MRKTKEDFLSDILINAAHHAKSVLPIVPEVYFRLEARGAKWNDWRTNIAWFSIEDKKYVVAYNHDKKKIDFRDKNQRGKTIFNLDKNTPIQDLDNFIKSL